MAAIAIAAPLRAQGVDVAPAPAAAAPTVAPAMLAAVPDGTVDSYYSAHPGIMVWLRDADTRAAAARLAALLKNSELDGLDNGAALAADVEAA
ncbi:MAG: hypothetical protein V4502_01390, partial [Pseudomonadota bacterium]